MGSRNWVLWLGGAVRIGDDGVAQGHIFVSCEVANALVLPMFGFIDLLNVLMRFIENVNSYFLCEF